MSLESEICNCVVSIFVCQPSQINGTLSPSLVYLAQDRTYSCREIFFKNDMAVDSISFKISVWTGTNFILDGLFLRVGRNIRGYEMRDRTL